MKKILIVDDHAIVRKGLKQIMEDIPDMDVAGEAINGSEAINMIRDKKWDIVLLDISMPGKNGLEILKQIKNEKPHLPVLILTIHSEEQYAIRALKAGVDGYLSKGCDPKQLIHAIRKIISGGKYITETLAEKLASSFNPYSSMEPHQNLSDREYQVFQMLASGIKVTAIANKLMLSAKTVSTHRSNILIKMKMGGNSELIYYAIENNLIEKAFNIKTTNS